MCSAPDACPAAILLHAPMQHEPSTTSLHMSPHYAPSATLLHATPPKLPSSTETWLQAAECLCHTPSTQPYCMLPRHTPQSWSLSPAVITQSATVSHLASTDSFKSTSATFSTPLDPKRAHCGDSTAVGLWLLAGAEADCDSYIKSGPRLWDKCLSSSIKLLLLVKCTIVFENQYTNMLGHQFRNCTGICSCDWSYQSLP